MIITTEFLHQAKVQRDARDLAPVVVRHPVSKLSEAENGIRAVQTAGQCVRILCGRSL